MFARRIQLSESIAERAEPEAVRKRALIASRDSLSRCDGGDGGGGSGCIGFDAFAHVRRQRGRLLRRQRLRLRRLRLLPPDVDDISVVTGLSERKIETCTRALAVALELKYAHARARARLHQLTFYTHTFAGVHGNLYAGIAWRSNGLHIWWLVVVVACRRCRARSHRDARSLDA